MMNTRRNQLPVAHWPGAPAPVFGVCGWKNSGKTTLAVRLVAELSRRGYRVATVKHAHHSFQIDRGETDSARHRSAGAGEVAVVSPRRWAMISEVPEGETEPDFGDVLSWFGPCDVIIVEGYKSQPIPKIETRRVERRLANPREQALSDFDPTVVAIAADHTVDMAEVPAFALDDIEAIADFVSDYLDLEARVLANGAEPCDGA